MKKGSALIVLMALAAMAVLAPGPCEPPEFEDSIDPFESYLGEFVNHGGVVEIFEAPSYLVGRNLDPASVNNATVSLEHHGSPVDGDAGFFDEEPCTLGGLTPCPAAIYFTPGGLGSPCDLDGDTAYVLILDGVLLEDGTSLPYTEITFYTASVLPGYTADFCSEQGYVEWTIDNVYPTAGSTDSISNGIAGISIDLEMFGVQDYGAYVGYRMVESAVLGVFCSYLPGIGYVKEMNSLNNDPFAVVLKIENDTALPVNLSTLIAGAPWVRLMDISDVIVDVAIPGDTIPANYTLLLYVATNGATFYMVPDQGGGEHSIDLVSFRWNYECSTGEELFPGNGFCPTMTPPEAFAFPPAATW